MYYNTPTATATPDGGGRIGTTTVILYTTITPGVGSTTTNNELVIISTTTEGDNTGATVSLTLVYAMSSDALGLDSGMTNLWSYGMVLAVVATVMILL